MLSVCFVACFIYLRLPKLPKFEEETHNDVVQWFLADAFVSWDQSKITHVYDVVYGEGLKEVICYPCCSLHVSITIATELALELFCYFFYLSLHCI